MRTAQSRLVVGALALAGLWVLTFWLWPTRGPEPAITFAGEPSTSESGTGMRQVAASGSTGQRAAPSLASVASAPQQQQPAPVVKEATVLPHEPARATPEPVKPEGRADAPTRQVIPPTFATRTVQAGQTMQTIARAVYGDAGKWTVIARANPKVDPVKLKAGTVLRIPVDPHNVQGISADQARAMEPAAQNGAGAATPAAAKQYVVQSGDTLSGISKKQYGTTTLWRSILDANRDQLREPEDIRAGMTLVIPPAPNAAGR